MNEIIRKAANQISNLSIYQSIKQSVIEYIKRVNEKKSIKI